MTRPRSNRQYVALAELMLILARESADALEHLLIERAAVDGWSASMRSDGMPRSASVGTIVERQIVTLADIDAQLAQVSDDMTAIASLTASALAVCRYAKGYRVAPLTEDERRDFPTPELSLCKDNQTGKEGANSWGDGVCLMPSVKAGLCQAHYMAWYRARRAAGIDTSHDFAPAV